MASGLLGVCLVIFLPYKIGPQNLIFSLYGLNISPDPEDILLGEWCYSAVGVESMLVNMFGKGGVPES